MSSESKPISVAEFEIAIKELTDDTIVGVQTSLETSLTKLHQTNQYLQDELSQSIDESDRQLYEETVQENNGVISSQELKLDIVQQELRVRGLIPTEETSLEGVYL